MKMLKENPVRVVEFANGQHVTVEGLVSLAGSNVFRVRYGRNTGYVFQRALVSKAVEAKEALADQGVVIINPADWRSLTQAFAGIDRFGKAPLIEQPGWTGSYYALPSGKVFRPKGDPRPQVMFKRQRSFIASKGKLKDWRDTIAKPLTGQVIPMVAILGALAAPLLRIIGDNENFGFEFSGPPETGKTTSLKVMASVSGNPQTVPTFNATLAGFEDRFHEFNDAPYPIDEANLAERNGPDFIKDFVFSMANGRARETRFAKDRTGHRFVFGSSANRPFFESLASTNTHIADAAIQRLLPLVVDEDSEFGVFDHLPPGYATSGELATHLKRAMEANYGTALKQFLKRLVEAQAHDAEGVRQQIELKIASFEAAVGLADSARGKSRASTAFGLLYAAGVFAQMHGILPAEWEVRAACLKGYERYRATLPNLKPWRARVAELLARPGIVRLEKRDLPEMSDEQVAQHGVFLRNGAKGRVELLIDSHTQHTHFPDWQSLMQTADFAGSVKADKGHATVHRQIRSNKDRERMGCIIVPPELLGREDL